MNDSYLDWMGWADEDFGRYGRELERYFALELKACGVSSLEGRKVGEIGFGNGAFAGWSRKAGAAWVGQEELSQLQERAKRAGFNVIEPGGSFSEASRDGAFDLIVAFDVIEHMSIEQIEAFLRDSHVALRAGGVMVARLPSGDSPYSGATFTGDLTHRTLLGTSAVRQLAGRTGFVVKQARSPVTPLRGAGVAHAAARAGRIAIQRVAFGFVRTFLMANRDAVLSPNMVIVLQKVTGHP